MSQHRDSIRQLVIPFQEEWARELFRHPSRRKGKNNPPQWVFVKRGESGLYTITAGY